MAYELARILHRDISIANIMILPNGKGILVDWELSKDVYNDASRTYERTVYDFAFAFISIVHCTTRELGNSSQ